jgi:hypothetical protein
MNELRNNKATTYRREGGALSPDAAVVADDGGGGEVVPVDLAHQVVVDVRLPRHLADWVSPLTQTEGTISRSLLLRCDCAHRSPAGNEEGRGYI